MWNELNNCVIYLNKQYISKGKIGCHNCELWASCGSSIAHISLYMWLMSLSVYICCMHVTNFTILRPMKFPSTTRFSGDHPRAASALIVNLIFCPPHIKDVDGWKKYTLMFKVTLIFKLAYWCLNLHCMFSKLMLIFKLTSCLKWHWCLNYNIFKQLAQQSF